MKQHDIDVRRIRHLNGHVQKSGPVVYWMCRDQRAEDNWALLYAQNCALEAREQLIVVFTLATTFLGTTIRQYGFMLRGLAETVAELERHNISCRILLGEPSDSMVDFCRQNHVGMIVSDFSPVRIQLAWKQAVAERLTVPVHEVDAHNCVPCWHASNKKEFAARTLRPKLLRLLPEFVSEFPKLHTHPFAGKIKLAAPDWKAVATSLRIDTSVPEVDWAAPGPRAAHDIMKQFIHKRMDAYASDRNNALVQGQSNLSPYFHFGQIAPQRVVLEIMNSKSPGRDAFFEELVVRRELADNFCLYEPKYDSVAGFPEWAQKTLRAHARDRRQYTYTYEEFDAAKTHDELWNAAQIEMRVTGKMHGYMRMYWAKKILEWTSSPEDALAIAITLNDRYELDGRDPNGYVGVAWSIGGVHDRPWFNRPIFGSVRYMSDTGCRRMFDVKAYIARWNRTSLREDFAIF